MNDADRKAFEAHWKKSTCDGYNEKLAAKAAWQAACEWRDSQSPTAQINQQLLEALDDYDVGVLRELAATLEHRSPSRYKALQKMMSGFEAALQAARGE